MNLQEEWRRIPGHPDYEASSLGRIRSWKRETSRQMTPNAAGAYHTVSLTTRGTCRTVNVHSLIAEAFHGPRPDGLEVRHLNGVAADNRAENLEYATHSVNMRDRVLHGSDVNASKTHCKRDHEFTEMNTRIWRGHRYCRACERVRRENRALRAASVPTERAA